MSSFVKTLRRWYSTVRGLMNSWAPISGFVCPWAARRATCAFLRRELVEGVDGAFADGFSGGGEFAAGAFGERVSADLSEHLVGGAELLACVDAAVFAAQPFAVEESAAREFECCAAVGEPFDRLAGRGTRRRSAAHGSAPGSRAPIRCRWPACVRSGARARRRPRRVDRCGRRPRSTQPEPEPYAMTSSRSHARRAAASASP